MRKSINHNEISKLLFNILFCIHCCVCERMLTLLHESLRIWSKCSRTNGDRRFKNLVGIGLTSRQGQWNLNFYFLNKYWTRFWYALFGFDNKCHSSIRLDCGKILKNGNRLSLTYNSIRYSIVDIRNSLSPFKNRLKLLALQGVLLDNAQTKRISLSNIGIYFNFLISISHSQSKIETCLHQLGSRGLQLIIIGRSARWFYFIRNRLSRSNHRTDEVTHNFKSNSDIVNNNHLFCSSILYLVWNTCRL